MLVYQRVKIRVFATHKTDDFWRWFTICYHVTSLSSIFFNAYQNAICVIRINVPVLLHFL